MRPYWKGRELQGYFNTPVTNTGNMVLDGGINRLVSGTQRWPSLCVYRKSSLQQSLYSFVDIIGYMFLKEYVGVIEINC